MWSVPLLPRTLEASLRDLDEPSPKVRLSAIGDLARHHGDPAARVKVLAGLRRGLRDLDASVRAATLSALGELGEAELLDAVLLAVDDKDALVRQMAIEALGHLGGERASQRVLHALSDERPEMRFQAVIAAPRVLGDEADEHLARCLRDEDGGVRYIALRVAEELQQQRMADKQAKGMLRDALLVSARRCLGDERADVKVAAAILLAHAGDDAGRQVLLDVAEDRLRTPEIEDEAAAVEAVGILGLREGVSALERRAYGPSRFFRERCAFHARVGLARLGHERARAEIISELRGWTRETRNQAVLAAARAGMSEARCAIEAMRGRPDRADEQVVTEALTLLP